MDVAREECPLDAEVLELVPPYAKGKPLPFGTDELNSDPPPEMAELKSELPVDVAAKLEDAEPKIEDPLKPLEGNMLETAAPKSDAPLELLPLVPKIELPLVLKIEAALCEAPKLEIEDPLCARPKELPLDGVLKKELPLDVVPDRDKPANGFAVAGGRESGGSSRLLCASAFAATSSPPAAVC